LANSLLEHLQQRPAIGHLMFEFAEDAAKKPEANSKRSPPLSQSVEM
jgi:hypothetical protein